MLSADQKNKAGELSIALQRGYAELSEAVAWADFIICNEDELDDEIFSISLARKTSTAISGLNRVSEGHDEWTSLRMFLKRFDNNSAISAADASELAKFLYMKTVYSDDTPEDMYCFSTHWDSIDLAVQQNLSNPIDAVMAFLSDIREVANA